jgi:hypothetical protein
MCSIAENLSQNLFIGFSLWFSEQIAVVPLNYINRLIFVTEMRFIAGRNLVLKFYSHELRILRG